MLGYRRVGEVGGGELVGCGQLGWRGDRWPPGVAGECVVDAGQDVGAVFAEGVDVAADVKAVLGDVFAGESSGDLLLGFGWA